MRKITDKEEIEKTKQYMEIAAEVAKKSTCTKSQRGALIVKNGKIIGAGYNKPTNEKWCTPCIRENIHDNSRLELCSANHAEIMAIFDALKKGGSLEGSVMYHIKVKNGEMARSGPATCTFCSRLILESGIKEFVLWHRKNFRQGYEQGYYVYTAEEFNELSFEYFLKRLI